MSNMLPRVQKNTKFNLATQNFIVYTPSSNFKPKWAVTRKVAMSHLWINHSFELICWSRSQKWSEWFFYKSDLVTQPKWLTAHWRRLSINNDLIFMSSESYGFRRLAHKIYESLLWCFCKFKSSRSHSL